jgi:hypothetical protein
MVTGHPSRMKDVKRNYQEKFLFFSFLFFSSFSVDGFDNQSVNQSISLLRDYHHDG